MARFRGLVQISGYITVEGDSMEDADDNARALSNEHVLALLAQERGGLNACDFEVFPDEFPELVR